MSTDSTSDWSKTSCCSGRSQRSGKSFSEKIRDLGYILRNERQPVSWKTLQFMDVKMEDNRSPKISIMTPELNLQKIMYYQPQRANVETSSSKSVYTIAKFETKSIGPKEITKITDIEVKSFKPIKKIKFRKKKRHSSMINRIEEILNRGKDLLPSRDPSEVSIFLNYKFQEESTKEISDFPENILQKIFFYLTQQERCLIASRVCKSWYYILQDPVFWTELQFVGDKVSKNTIVQLLNKYHLLESLRLTSVPDAVKILQELCRCNHSIKKLGVRHCDVGSQNFGSIILHVISCCINLEFLDIKGMRFQSERFYLELGRLKNLRGLNLTGTTLKNQDLKTLSVNCRALQGLKILDLTLDNTKGATLKDDDLTFIISHLEVNLNILKIDMQQATTVSYQAILNCPHLKCLALKNCLLLSSDTFRKFPELTELKYFKITRAVNLKPEDFEFVFTSESMKNIEDLDINGCWGVGEFGLLAIAQKLNSLKSLSLQNCKSIRGKNLAVLSRCSKLRSLNVSHLDITPHHLLPLVRSVNKLETLTIDSKLNNKSTVQELKKFLPFLRIKISHSEFQKDERLLNDF